MKTNKELNNDIFTKDELESILKELESEMESIKKGSGNQ